MVLKERRTVTQSSTPRLRGRSERQNIPIILVGFSGGPSFLYLLSMRTPLRSLALKIHLYLGLTAGAVILVLCLTGALLSFETEITTALHPERYHVEGNGVPVPLAVGVEAIQVASPDAKIGGVTVTTEPGRPWDFSLGQGGRAFVDPYTGALIETGVRRAPFFQKTMELHRWLLADELGGINEQFQFASRTI